MKLANNLVIAMQILIATLVVATLVPRASASPTVLAISGTVRDPTGRPCSDCTVELKSENRATLTTQTDSAGSFGFGGLEPGEYLLKVSATPSNVVRKMVVLSVGSSNVEDVMLPKPIGFLSPHVSHMGEAKVTPWWNVWAEQQPFVPVTELQIDSEYRLMVDLAALPYSQSLGLYKRQAGEELSKWLTGGTGALKVLVVPDPGFIRLGSHGEQAYDLRIDVKRLNEQLGKDLKINKDPFDLLRHNPNAGFSFGRVAIPIRTTTQTGQTNVALSLWANGQPVDELSVPLCIGERSKCSIGGGEFGMKLRGLDSVRIAAGKGPDDLPDAAIHFVALYDDSVTGVFRCNKCDDWGPDEYHTWRIPRSATWIVKYLVDTVLVDFENSANNDIFRRHGKELFAALFPPDDTGNSARSDDTFAKYVQAIGQKSQDGRPRSLYVRSILGDEDVFVLVPLGLAVPPTATLQLGFLFRLEMPLPRQRYEHSGDCISNWNVFLPKRNPNVCQPANLDACDEMQRLAFSFGDWADRLSAWQGHTKAFFDTGFDIDKFAAWLSDSSAEPDANEALLLMSHHDADRLFFDPAGTDTIEATSVQRRFSAPTLVFLNACGTGKPGFAEFIRRFNENGANAVIATSTAVDAEMAGKFSAILLSHLKDNVTIGDAWFSSVQELAALGYGPRALEYVLAGDSGIRVCSVPHN